MKERMSIFRGRRWIWCVCVCLAAGIIAVGESNAEEMTNESCIECHNADILKLSKDELAEQVDVGDKPAPPKVAKPYVFGDLNLAIDPKKYSGGVHADTKCVECHTDVKEIPHAQRLKPVDCKACHEEHIDNVMASAHGKGPKAVGCVGCHDVHYGKGKDSYVETWKRKACEDCHVRSGLPTVAKAHDKLYEPALHLKMDCLTCHKGDEPGVHYIPPVKTKVAKCEACHGKKSILAKLEDKTDYRRIDFINKDGMKKHGYVIGMNRVPALDAVLILLIIGPLALPIFHGGLRILTRRKEPFVPPEEKILLHPATERLWHWVHALCIVVLIVTGAMIHWPEVFPGYFQTAVTVHNWFGVITVIDFLLWLVYNLTTRRIRHYIPRKGDIPKGMVTQAKFYAHGIFKHEPHPYAPSEDNKFNPLQKIAYLQFQVLLMPILLVSGVLYLYPEYFGGIIAAIGGMTILGIIHLLLAALFTAFLVAHLYLATTGETVGENFKAIIFGYGLKMDHHH
ncbi:MAG: cytochrome b/b6 domain-containing protein [Thermodesulfobacteriota bacterium]